MNMQEALEWAADFADRSNLFAPIKNERGYADGWKPPTPADKAAIIADLAKKACDDTGQDRTWWVLVSLWMHALDAACGSESWPQVRDIKGQMQRELDS